jgi:predicted SprT family Zn-dependent metalloprotease
MGWCDISHKVIEISPVYALYLTEEHLEQLMLHEIAHAITGHGHTPTFRIKCKEIGCKTVRAKWNSELYPIRYAKTNFIHDNWEMEK